MVVAGFVVGVVAMIAGIAAAYFGYLPVRHLLPWRRSRQQPPPLPPHGPSHLFLAYVQADAAWAEKLASDLVTKNVRVWLYEWEKTLGDVRLRKLGEGLRNSRVPAPIFSPRSVADREFLDLYAMGLEQVHGSGERLIPIVVDGAERPPFAAIREPADFTGVRGSAYTAMVERLAEAALRAPDPAA
jgi:hypothetical protein